jgi:hypothetical protein
MSFDVPPLARLLAASSVDRSPRPPDHSDAPFPNPEIDGVTPLIPAEVWEQIDAAAQLAERLHAQGRAVRFDVHEPGEVMAELVGDDGERLRSLLLEDVVDVDRLSHELGKEPN